MTALQHEPLVLDVSRTPAIPFSRLLRVELRKMVDTRAGLWMLISIGLVTALVLVIQLWVGLAQDMSLTFQSFMMGMNTPMGVLLPVLGILSVTQEFGQRTALVTFTQVPSRLRLFLAKFVSVLVLAVGALIVGLVLASIANLLFSAMGGSSAVWGVGALDLGGYFLLHAFGLATGFAFGVLLLNSPAAIVAYFVYSFVLPGLFAIGAQLIGWFKDLQPWLDFNGAQTPLMTADMTGKDWSHLAVSGLIWLVLPLVLGFWRVLRAEVK